MNSNPHVHKVEVRREYSSLNEGGWIVEYGDTKRYITWKGRFFINHAERRPSDKKIRRAIELTVRQHDRGSVLAESYDDQTAYEIGRTVSASLRADQWASEQLKEITSA